MSGGNAKAVVALVAGFALGGFTFWAVSDTAPPEGRSPGDSVTGSAGAETVHGTTERRAADAAVRTEHAPRARAAVDGGSASRPAAAGVDSNSPAQRGPRATSVAPAGAAAGASGSAPHVAGGSTDPSSGAASAAAAPAAGTHDSADAGPSSSEREARGVVVDGATQTPVAGARVLLAALDGPQAGAWWGATSDAEGRFSVRVTDDRALPARFQIRVSRDGYDSARVAPAAGDVRVQLATRSTPMLPGRVLGTAHTADGKPFAGEVEIAGYDEQGNNASQRALADALGKFTLAGGPPGRWRFGWLRGPQRMDGRRVSSSPTSNRRRCRWTTPPQRRASRSFCA